MADNVTLSAGSEDGAAVATEDIASVHYQKVKLTASGNATTADLSHAEDASHTSGDHGLMALAVRNDTLAALAGTDGDYAPLQVNASGALFTAISSIAAGDNNIGNVDIVTLPSGNLNARAMTASLCVTLATDDTHFGAVGAEADVDGVVHGQLRYMGQFLATIDADTGNIATQTANLQNTIGTDGSAGPTKTLSMGGTESGGNIQELRVDSDGHLQEDVLSIIPGTGATNLGKACDAGHTSGDTGVAIFGIRNDSNTVMVNADLDYLNLCLDSSGRIKLGAGSLAIGKLAANDGVDIGNVDVTSLVPGTAATSLGKAEDAGHTTGDTGVMALAVRNDSNAALTGTNLDYSPISVDSAGRIKLAAGSVAIGKLAANTGVDIGDVDVTSIVPGVAATSLGKARASALGATDTGVAALAVRNDDLADLAGADGDYTPLQVNAEGALFVTDADSEIKEFMVIGTTNGNNTLVAAVGSRKIRLLSLVVLATSATANTFYLVNDDYNVLGSSAAKIPIAVDADADNVGGVVIPQMRRTTDTVNQALVAVQSATAALIYMGTYTEVPA